MTTTELLTVIAAVIVIAGLVWYLRVRRPAGLDPDLEREHHRAEMASEEVRTEAMVRRYCPHCGVERDFRAGQCVECGYRLS